MPNVAGVEFPYTPEGERAAFEAQRELDELLRGATYARPGSPLGGTPWERQDQQRIEDIKRQFRFGLEDRYQTDPRTGAVMLDEFGQPFRGDPFSQQTPGWQQPMTQAPRGQTTRTTDPGAGYGQSPSGPTAQMPTRQPQAPRQNVTEQFSVPANYGSSPSNPNWGAERGGLRPIGRMGPVGSDIGRETVRQRQQPTFRDVSHRPQDWKEQMLDKLRGVMAIPGQVKQETGGLIGSAVGQASQRANQQIGNMMAYGGFGPQGFSQQSPSSPWYRPVAQAPRGQTIQTSGPANYGQSPSNPNWKPPKP